MSKLSNRQRKISAQRYKKREIDRYMTEEHVSFAVEDNVTVRGTLTTPKSQIKAKALMLHEIEGFRNAGRNIHQKVAHRWARQGIASLRIDFSGHRTRRDEWKRYSPQSMVNDARASIDFLDQQIPSIAQTILTGASTGGSIAIILGAVDERVSSRILLYPVISYRNNFLSAANGNAYEYPEAEWDLRTPWRSDFFKIQDIEASLERNAPFELFVHTYGANFIKGCQHLIDNDVDVEKYLLHGRDIPTTIIHGTHDPVLYHKLTADFARIGIEGKKKIRMLTMAEMQHCVDRNWQSLVLHQYDRAVLKPFEAGVQSFHLNARWRNRYAYPDIKAQLPPEKTM